MQLSYFLLSWADFSTPVVRVLTVRKVHREFVDGLAELFTEEAQKYGVVDF